MIIVGKILVSILIFLGVLFFSYWALFVPICPHGMAWLASVAALLTAAMVTRLCWHSMSAGPQGIFGTIITWAAVVGAISFCAGFFGPMILAPQANQGPLLGLFITGPLGFIGGAIAGLIYGLWRRRGTSAG